MQRSPSLLPVSQATPQRSWFGFGGFSTPSPPKAPTIDSEPCGGVSAPSVPPKPLPPPPKATTRRGTPVPSASADVLLQIRLHKPRGAPLGVRFHEARAEAGGALLELVEPHSLAWRAKLRAGDAVLAVLVPQTSIRDRRVNGGCEAAEVLRPAVGPVVLTVRRPRWTAEDEAAARVQAGWEGWLCRQDLDERGWAATLGAIHHYGAAAAHGAATRIQAHWRRCVAAADVWDLLEEAAARAADRATREALWARADEEDDAAELIQAHWRRWSAETEAWERRLALEEVQRLARGWLARRRAAERAAAAAAQRERGGRREGARREGVSTGRAAVKRPRRCIRSPPTLDFSEDD